MHITQATIKKMIFSGGKQSHKQQSKGWNEKIHLTGADLTLYVLSYSICFNNFPSCVEAI
jgi:hypothetical protein